MLDHAFVRKSMCQNTVQYNMMMCQRHFGTSCSLRVGSEPSCPHLVVVSERGGFKPSMKGAAMVPSAAASSQAWKARRKLLRNMSKDCCRVDVQSVKCIRGGKRKQWLVLETQVAMGRECVGIKSTQKWLHVLLAGRLHQSTFHSAIGNFVEDCIEALRGRDGVPAASSQAPPIQADPSRAAAAQSQKGKAGRAAIIQRDSSDEDDDVKPKKIARTKRSCRKTVGWTTVSVRGMIIECFRGRGRQLLVPIDGGHLDMIVQHLLPRAGEPPRLPRLNCATLLNDQDVGYIGWRATKASSQLLGFWQIKYINKQGACVRSRSELHVPRASLCGRPLTVQEQTEAANMVLRRARVEWNRLDCSGAERLTGNTT